MQETLQALKGLQKIDRLIFRVQSELKRLPAELNARASLVSQQEERLQEVKQRAHGFRSEAKEIEDYTVTMRQRARKLDNESTSQKIDAALLASFQHEIRTLKKNISRAEDDALGKLEAAEQCEKEAEALEQALETEHGAFEEFQTAVQRELSDAEGNHSALQARRDEQTQDGIEAKHLELYRRLLEIREGEALAELADGHCQSCFVRIPKNLGVRLARGAELVQCPSCDRILYQY